MHYIIHLTVIYFTNLFNGVGKGGVVNGKRIANYNSEILSPDVSRISMVLTGTGKYGKKSLVHFRIANPQCNMEFFFFFFEFLYFILFIFLYNRFLLVIYFTHISVYMSRNSCSRII